MKKRWLIFLIPFLLAGAQLGLAQDAYRVEQRSGVWWFVTPSGEPALSAGVDTVTYQGDVIKGTKTHPYHASVAAIYPNEFSWGAAAIEKLHRWGFNTLGAWSDAHLWDRGMAYTVILNIAARSGASWQYGRPVDVYDPKFEQAAREIAAQECKPRAHDAQLLGYFSDNELRWGPDWRGKQNMLAMYLSLPATAPGRAHAIEFLRMKYKRIAALNRAWRTHAAGFDDLPDLSANVSAPAFEADNLQFLAHVATRYFDVCARAIRAADPNHLYLGARFSGKPPDPVIRAAHVADVVSINIYQFDPRLLVKHVYELTHRPVLITEFAFRAENSGLPNTQGAGPKVADQAARAQAYRDFVTELESLPEAVGYHWFEWCDEPHQGRFDGENSNYGLVSIKDQPYTQFVNAVTEANQQALAIHQKAN
ncbi:MAG TPA: agarase [Terriglobia bacterium]|nr:agarase [Terriglobia bacterium]